MAKNYKTSSGGRTVSCGERLAAAPTDLVDVRLELSGVPRCVAQLVGPAGPVAGTVVATETVVHGVRVSVLCPGAVETAIAFAFLAAAFAIALVWPPEAAKISWARPMSASRRV